MHGKPGAVTEKSKDFKGSMKRLFKHLDKWRYFIIVAMILSSASAVLGLINPNKLSNLTDTIADGIKPNISEKTVKEIMSSEDISQKDKAKFMTIMSSATEGTKDTDKLLKSMDKLPKSIYNRIKPEINVARVKSLSIFILSILIISALFNYIQGLIMTITSNKFAKKLRSDISNKINRLKLKYFDSHETGDILSRITNDVDSIVMNMNHSLSTLANSATLFIGSIIMMFVTNWIMALTAIVSAMIGFGLMGIILKNSQKYFSERQKKLGDLNGYIEEIYSAHNVVKAYNGKKSSKKEFDKLNEDLFVCNKKSQFLSGIMQPIMMFVGNFGYVAVCIVGAILTTKGIITFGVIVAFMIYIRMFTNPLQQMAQAMTSMQSIAAASERVFDFLEEEEMSDESSFKEKIKNANATGLIEFDHVKFGYNPDKLIIKDFSAKIRPGQKIAIVGPTGAGKTTIVNLLMKFYEINKGNIYIDGISTNKLKRENIHDLFVMVLQDTWLFDGTIRENLKFNNEEVTDEEIIEICKKTGIYHFIKSLPGGLDANINDNDSISQGQKQLLTIARGMLKKAPFLILDEATSNVDTRTEELVQKAMDKLAKGKTSFIIAHRLSTIKNADMILVMNEGNIIEQGTHEELLDKKGFYADLYNSQFDTLS